MQAFSQSQNPANYKVKSNGFYENKGQVMDQNYKPNPSGVYMLQVKTKNGLPNNKLVKVN